MGQEKIQFISGSLSFSRKLNSGGFVREDEHTWPAGKFMDGDRYLKGETAIFNIPKNGFSCRSWLDRQFG